MCVSLMVAQLAVGAMGAMVAINQANQAARQAEQQAKDAYKAAEANTKAKYAETNRQIAEEQIDAMNEKSDKIREANYALGTFRAAETSLSEGSLGTVFFEQLYGEHTDYIRLERNQQRQFWALESEKTAAEINYINETTVAKNQAGNAIREANARASAAFLGALGSGLKVGANYNYQQQMLGQMAQQ